MMNLKSKEVNEKPRTLTASWDVEKSLEFCETDVWHKRIFRKLVPYKIRKRFGWLSVEEQLAENWAEQIRKDIDREILKAIEQQF